MDRGWMYKRNDKDGYLSLDYCIAVDGFLDFAFSNQRFVERKTVGRDIVFRIKCPCLRCKILKYMNRDEVKLHLCKYGFVADYTTWWAHGESASVFQHEAGCSNPMGDDEVDGCTRMVEPTIYNHTTLHTNTWEEHRGTLPSAHTRRGSVSTAVSATGEGSSSGTQGYVTNKAGNFAVAYRETMTGKYGADETQWPLMESDVRQQCAALSKGSVYGFGSMANPNVMLSQSSGTLSTGRSSTNLSGYTTNEEVERIVERRLQEQRMAMETQITEMEENRRREMEENRRREMEEYRKVVEDQRKTMELQMQEFRRIMARLPRSPP